jgi:hypothetical protein
MIQNTRIEGTFRIIEYLRQQSFAEIVAHLEYCRPLPARDHSVSRDESMTREESVAVDVLNSMRQRYVQDPPMFASKKLEQDTR